MAKRKKQGKAKNVKKGLIVDNITFKSELERDAYLCLKKCGLNPSYEPVTYTLIDGFKPTVTYYEGEKNKPKSTILNLKLRKLTPIKYTPDFEFDYNNKHVVIETKGWENDAFPMRFKLFRKLMESKEQPYIIAKIFTIGQLETFITLLKNYF